MRYILFLKELEIAEVLWHFIIRSDSPGLDELLDSLFALSWKESSSAGPKPLRGGGSELTRAGPSCTPVLC
eukprot:CAMPEP_0196733548 /NCGR_PEP_ID=MMETSP1091-20130531/12554_1 /TAXON_ID=302021 /ORGANISM="Rhodomonas sp., Strain CCMP768" /LENGTH=70 /DNA_ID=CAMNT_0042076931 /DNA_START=56 /DNA_END=268 /DNA_ORIENTATION=-